MLYSFVATTIILAFTIPIACFYSFVKGYNLRAEKHGEKPIKAPTRPKKSPKGDQRLEQLLANIDAYDGTEKGQKVIE